MSFDRSMLESKGRADLVEIAQTMGLTVGSRMRKYEVVDLILGDAADAVADADDKTSVSSTSGETSISHESEAAETRGGASTDDGNRSTPADADKRDADRRDADKRDADKRDADASGSAKRGASQGNTDQSGANKDGAHKDGANKNGANQDRDSGGRSNDKHHGKNDNSDGAADQQDDGDQGNRRRRRRRGRDRDEMAWEGEPVAVDGHLDLRSDGYGFLRVQGGNPSREDCYVPVKMVREFGLRAGDQVRGTSRPAARNEKNPALLTVHAINERDPAEARNRPDFDDLTPIFPDEQLVLERATTPADLTARIVDLVTPIGKGQRGLIVAPPKAGKTTVIKEIVRSIETNHPEVHLLVLLLDERPEEVTDMKRWMKNGEVIASTFDRPTDEHIAVAEMVGERARRLVESGIDVCIVMDGITRLARAYNVSGRFSGRTMSGGVDAGALYPAKRFFGAARNVEEGGSLTILATALVDTGSKMDEVIFEEFKGTGNMELRLDRTAAEKRLFPAVDVTASSTRHDELLLAPRDHAATNKMRRVLDAVGDEGSNRTQASLELLLDRLQTFRTNAEFLNEVAKSR